MSFQCEYCESTFKSKYNLNTHQKSAKFCIKKSNKMEKEIEQFKCDYCYKIYTTKFSLDLHISKCNKKIEYDYQLLLRQESDKIKNLYETKLKDLENENERLKLDIQEYKEQIKDLAKTAIQKPVITHNNNSKNNSIKNIDARTVNMLPLESIKNTLKENLEKNFTMNHLMKGQRGVAQFLVENVLITRDKKFLFKCIDPSRKTFCYLDMDGNVVKDVNAVNLTNLIHDPIKERTLELYNEVQERLNQVYNNIPDDLEEDAPELGNLREEQDRASYATEKASDITNIKMNNSEMVRHLIPPLTVK